jgi:hypothetical protein
VLANGWRVAALRAASAGEPVWAGHRPKQYRKQPLWKADYVRAIADAAMAGGRWVVTLDGDWQAGLLTGTRRSSRAGKRSTRPRPFLRITPTGATSRRSRP